MDAATAAEDEKKNVYGFVFAFLKYSQLERPKVMERLVRVASWSDTIHVAIVPAVISDDSRVNVVGEYAYTAFIHCGVIAQPVDQVLNHYYSYKFLPVRCIGVFQSGVRFLESLVGVRYNNLSLLSTLLPARCVVSSRCI